MKLSITDDLTGLHNSRHFFNQLKAEIERTNRYGHPLSLLILDLDNFKKYNDTSGYLERTSGIECGSGFQPRQLTSRLEAAPTEGLSNGTWTFQISRIFLLKQKYPLDKKFTKREKKILNDSNSGALLS